MDAARHLGVTTSAISHAFQRGAARGEKVNVAKYVPLFYSFKRAELSLTADALDGTRG